MQLIQGIVMQCHSPSDMSLASTDGVKILQIAGQDIINQSYSYQRLMSVGGYSQSLQWLVTD